MVSNWINRRNFSRISNSPWTPSGAVGRDILSGFLSQGTSGAATAMRRNFKGIPVIGVFAVAYTVCGAGYRDLALLFGSMLVVVLLPSYIRLRREYPRVQAELADVEAFARNPH